MDIFGMIKKMGEGAVRALNPVQQVESVRQAVMQPRLAMNPQVNPAQQVQNVRQAAAHTNMLNRQVNPMAQIQNVVAQQEEYEPVDPIEIAGFNENSIPTSPAFVSHVMNKPEPWYQNALETDRQAAQGWQNVLPIYLRNR